jgi:hypothetical protein
MGRRRYFRLVLSCITPPGNADFYLPSGLPVLRMPIGKLLSPFRTNRTTGTGSRSHTHDHQLRTIGKVPSRGTTKNLRHEHDDGSYEELIEPVDGSKKLSDFNRV